MPLHFTGHYDDLVFFAMECVGGNSRAQRFAREPQTPVADAVRIPRGMPECAAMAVR